MRLSSFFCRFELNFAINVVGVYAVTELLLPSLEKAAPDAHVITVSSGGMYNSPLTSDLQVRIFVTPHFIVMFYGLVHAVCICVCIRVYIHTMYMYVCI